MRRNLLSNKEISQKNVLNLLKFTRIAFVFDQKLLIYVPFLGKTDKKSWEY
jgi:hypothetical protein